jgi:hypothetical protein
MVTSARIAKGSTRSSGAPGHLVAGEKFWFSRNRLVGSYAALILASRSQVAPGYAERMRAWPSSVRKPTYAPSSRD